MVGSYWSNSDPWGCPGARVMAIFGSQVDPQFPNIGQFTVWSNMAVYECIYSCLKVYQGMLTHIPLYSSLRNHSGCVIRWGEGQFEEVRDSLGWDVRKDDKLGLENRVQIIMNLFKRYRITAALEALCDAPLAIVDA